MKYSALVLAGVCVVQVVLLISLVTINRSALDLVAKVSKQRDEAIAGWNGATEGWKRANKTSAELLKVVADWQTLHAKAQDDFAVCNSMLPKGRRL